VTSSENHAKLYELNKMVGSVLGPFEAWLAMRGLKTLPLRVCRQCSSAMRVAEWLAKHPKVKRVNYPGLRDHPQHRLANRLFNGKGFGGVLSFEINGADQAGAFRFMDALELCVPATSLGDIYTLVLHPATSSHRALSAEERRRFGIGDGLVRLSTGIEEPEDIISDLQQALTKV
jgi:cystathionine gamma-synthase/methionine-gamma-lyase